MFIKSLPYLQILSVFLNFVIIILSLSNFIMILFLSRIYFRTRFFILQVAPRLSFPSQVVEFSFVICFNNNLMTTIFFFLCHDSLFCTSNIVAYSLSCKISVPYNKNHIYCPCQLPKSHCLPFPVSKFHATQPLA